MTQPDRRHLRRARLALAVVVAAALAAWLWFPGGRTFLQQSLTALASLDPQQVRGLSPPGGRRPRWSHLR
ncbi:alkaline phosphatase [Klebsiella pneumoniae]|nr:alkaline phosphatase [Klebsiella pneumoniae]